MLPLIAPATPRFAPAPAEKKAQDISSALSRLDSAITSTARNRKKIAADRLEMLKIRLQMLRMFSAGDGKSRWREAVQIVREINAAVREYMDSSKSGAATATTVTSAVMPGTSSEDEQFLNLARQLAAEVNALLDAEKKKQRGNHAAIAAMDEAMQGVQKFIAVPDQAAPAKVPARGWHA